MNISLPLSALPLKDYKEKAQQLHFKGDAPTR